MQDKNAYMDDILEFADKCGDLLEEIFSNRTIYNVLIRKALGLNLDEKSSEVRSAISFLGKNNKNLFNIEQPDTVLCSSFCRELFSKIISIGKEWIREYFKLGIEEDIYKKLLSIEKKLNTESQLTVEFNQITFEDNQNHVAAEENVQIATKEEYIYLRIGYTLFIDIFRYVTNNIRFRILLAIYYIQGIKKPTRYEITEFLKERYNITVSQSNFSNTVTLLSSFISEQDNLDTLAGWITRPFVRDTESVSIPVLQKSFTLRLGLVNIGLLPGYSRKQMYTLTRIGKLLVSYITELGKKIHRVQEYEDEEDRPVNIYPETEKKIIVSRDEFNRKIDTIINYLENGQIAELMALSNELALKLNGYQLGELLLRISQHFKKSKSASQHFKKDTLSFQ